MVIICTRIDVDKPICVVTVRCIAQPKLLLMVTALYAIPTASAIVSISVCTWGSYLLRHNNTLCVGRGTDHGWGGKTLAE